MKSEINLYYKSLVEEDKNFIVESNGTNSISTYLVTLTKVTKTGFQYIKHNLTLSIKIDMSQTNLEFGSNLKDMNYCSIKNYDDVTHTEENIVYYFIAKKNWKSENTIELVLHMDTLNTFQWQTDYKVSAKTLVKRMHKDRFKYYGIKSFSMDMGVAPHYTATTIHTDLIVGASDGIIIGANFVGVVSSDLEITECVYVYDSSSKQWYIRIKVHNDGNVYHSCKVRVIYQSNCLIRVIDEKSEDIVAPKFKQKEDTLIDTNDNGVNWSLYYRNSVDQDYESPVDCYLLTDQAITLKYKATNGKIDGNNLASGKWAYFAPEFPDQPITFIMGDWFAHPYVDYRATLRTIYYGVCVHNNGGTIELYQITLDRRTGPQSGISYNYTLLASGTKVEIPNSPDTLYGRIENAKIEDANTLYELLISRNAPDSFSMPTASQSIPIDKASIDKTLSENIKIINIPYSPTPFKRTGNTFEVAQCWSYDSGMIKLNDVSVRFKNEIVTTSDSLLKSYLDAKTIDVTANRYVDDSKLFNSDYYQVKFVYDSFSRNFNLEAIDFDSTIANHKESYFKFEFVMSRNITSKFLFKFDFTYKLSTEDYENIVYVARNNEEVLYSSQYLNYVRTGYNYDIKAKERQEDALKTGLILSGASMGASALFGLATGNPLALATGAMSGFSFYGQIINYARTTAQAEENIQRKLDESRVQAVSVLNADDYDLMYEYTQNKPKLCYYSVSERMKKVLNDLFYYCGYTINEQRVPSLFSRYWFNFVQADLVITETDNLDADIIQDIKDRFSNGVTCLHGRTSGDATIWDFAQQKENWEDSLL